MRSFLMVLLSLVGMAVLLSIEPETNRDGIANGDEVQPLEVRPRAIASTSSAYTLSTATCISALPGPGFVTTSSSSTTPVTWIVTGTGGSR